MCLIAVAWRAHIRFPLVVIANRDEFHARPAAAAGFVPDASEVYGGRDLLQGGSWLLVSTRNGFSYCSRIVLPAARARSTTTSSSRSYFFVSTSVFIRAYPWPNCFAASRTTANVSSISAFVVRKFVMHARNANFP